MSASTALCLISNGDVTETVAATQLELPLGAWDEGLELKAQDGTKLQRWGSIGEMSRILYNMERRACYALLDTQKVAAFKLGHASNAHYRVDLLSVWLYRQEHCSL